MTTEKLPVISGRNLVKALGYFGYEIIRIRGSHIRIRTEVSGRHSLTIPDHKEVDKGLLSSILNDVAIHHNIRKKDVIDKIKL